MDFAGKIFQKIKMKKMTENCEKKNIFNSQTPFRIQWM